MSETDTAEKDSAETPLTTDQKLDRFAKVTLDRRSKTGEANDLQKEASKLKGDPETPGTLLNYFVEAGRQSVKVTDPAATIFLKKTPRAKVVPADEDEGVTGADKVRLVEALIEEGLGDLVTINYQSATSYLKKLHEEEGSSLDEKHPDLVGLLGIETVYDLSVRKAS